MKCSVTAGTIALPVAVRILWADPVILEVDRKRPRRTVGAPSFDHDGELMEMIPSIR
jgi:hypothetical protein